MYSTGQIITPTNAFTAASSIGTTRVSISPIKTYCAPRAKMSKPKLTHVANCSKPFLRRSYDVMAMTLMTIERM